MLSENLSRFIEVARFIKDFAPFHEEHTPSFTVTPSAKYVLLLRLVKKVETPSPF
jgi:hypothetical protein